jgi:hypothetical protein
MTAKEFVLKYYPNAKYTKIPDKSFAIFDEDDFGFRYVAKNLIGLAASAGSAWVNARNRILEAETNK